MHDNAVHQQENHPMPATTLAAAAEGLPRERIEAAIEALIALLDATEPDSDLEPSLGWNPYGAPDLEGDDSELEPSLGWTVTGAHGALTDAEFDDCDDEPSDNG